MFTYLTDIWNNVISVVRYITLVDIFDILFLSVIVFFVIKLMRETRAEQLIKGIIIFALLLLLLDQFQFKVMGLVAETFFNIGILAVIIMFQPELRRMLEKAGRTKMSKVIPFFDSGDSEISAKNRVVVDAVVKSCESLSCTRTGALIVLERQTKLGEQIETGTILDAVPSAALFGNIFVVNTPLHDGAVIIRNGLIHAAACYLPKPQNEVDINKELGTRHRAAIGMSEVSDAVIVVVSEETGVISVAENGILDRNYSGKTLRARLEKALIPEKAEKEKGERPADKAGKGRKKKKSSVQSGNNGGAEK